MTASPDAQVMGESIHAFINGLSSDAAEILAKYNLPQEVENGVWYSQKAYVDMMHEVEQKMFITDMVSMGMNIATFAPLPPQIDSLESALAGLNPAYQMNHRKVAEGEGWGFEKVDERTYVVTDRTPYPENFSYGVVYGFVKRFAPPGAGFLVITEAEDGARTFRVELDAD
ncbi:MAG: hypothetical protein K8S97_09115 [Anaerolineae bacterium]|nr:hypothetical protein [Anaerolineae bacterium]